MPSFLLKDLPKSYIVDFDILPDRNTGDHYTRQKALYDTIYDTFNQPK